MGRSRVFARIAAVYLRPHNNDVGPTTPWLVAACLSVIDSVAFRLFASATPFLLHSHRVLGSNDLSTGQRPGVVHGQCPLCACPLVRKKSHKIGSGDGNIQREGKGW